LQYSWLGGVGTDGRGRTMKEIIQTTLAILILALAILIRGRLPKNKSRRRSRVVRSGRYGWIEEIEKSGPVLMYRKDTK